jgi:transposase
MGVTNYVVQPQDWDERGKGVRNAGQRLQSMGRSLLASHGIHVTGKWWKGKTWRAIQAEALEERKMTLAIQEEGLQNRAKIPRGVGPLTFEVLRREVDEWSRFTNRRRVSSYTGLCPRETSSGGKRKGGSVTKSGN